MPRGSGYTQPGNWATLKLHILNRDEHRCYCCGGEATTVDHVIPVAAGGTHTEGNLAAICVPCHDVKTEAERRTGYANRKPRTNRRRPPELHPGALNRT